MTGKSRLDGAVPLDHDPSQDARLTALTRRVIELEHRLNVMKVIVGLVLAGKGLLVALILYVLIGGGFAVRSGGPVRTIARALRQTEGSLSFATTSSTASVLLGQPAPRDQ